MHKTYPAQIKAAGEADGLAEGQFRAVVSVFGNQDSYGDVVVPGAFTQTLADWSKSGDRIPVYWSHQMHDPDFNVGWVEEAKETEQGLEVLASLDLDPEATSKAKQVYRLLKGRRVTQFSFAYDVVDGGPVEKDGHSYNELRALKLYELGPTPVGANDQTVLLGVKALVEAAAEAAAGDAPDPAALALAIDTALTSAVDLVSDLDATALPEEVQQALVLVQTASASAGDLLDALGAAEPAADPSGATASAQAAAKARLKAGRVLSSKNEQTLREALDGITSSAASIKSVLAAVATDDSKASTNQEKASASAGPATAKEPSGATAKEPSRSTPVATLAADLSLLALE